MLKKESMFFSFIIIISYYIYSFIHRIDLVAIVDDVRLTRRRRRKRIKST